MFFLSKKSPKTIEILYIFCIVFCINLLANDIKNDNNFLNFEINTLSHLDINPNFVLDKNFVDFKKDIREIDKIYAIKILKNNQETIANIRRILKEKNMPSELLYLAMVESTFNPHSKSSVKAVGIWQFMAPTAKKLGLRIDGYIDERKDPIRSTYAAIKYLNMLKSEFGKWYLALMAYNCGNGKLRSAIRKAGTDEIGVLLDEDKKYIPLETRRFIKKIIVMALLSNDKDYLFGDKDYLLNYSQNLKFKKVFIRPRQSVEAIAKYYGMSIEEFKQYNPHFKSIYTPTYGYDAYIPKEKMVKLNKKLNDEKLLLAMKYKLKKGENIGEFITYKVKSGDNLGRIAQRFNTSINTLKLLNDLKGSFIKEGQTLIIEKQSKNNLKIIKTNTNNHKKSQTYVVQKGDTLSGISKKFKVSVLSIQNENQLLSSDIRFGQKLLIPQIKNQN